MRQLNLTLVYLEHAFKCWLFLIGKIKSTSKILKKQARIKDRNTQMTEDCSLPSMGSTYNILLPCSDFHSRLGTPSHSYSGCGNSIMCRGMDCKQGAEPWQAGPAPKPAGVKLICKTTSSWWLQVRNYSYSEFCHRLSPHFTSLCYSFSFLGEANTAKSIFISHSPPPFVSEQAKG